MAPNYIADLLLEKPDCFYQQRSNDQGLLFIPKTRPRLWGTEHLRTRVHQHRTNSHITLEILNQMKILNLN